jgi:hypothetical protein
MKFRTGRAAIAFHGRPFAKLQSTIGEPDDSFIAFTLLSGEEAPLVRLHLPQDTEPAVLLPAGNFDPPEDHPAEPEFTWAPILLNDFSDINDDVGTEAGVSHGDFNRLLQWQPTIDSTKTQLIAIIAPGPFRRTKVVESGSIPILGQKLIDYGYSAVGVRCKAGSNEEFADATSYATRLAETSGLTILHVACEGRDISGTPFSLSIRKLWTTADP